jgi:hypothetical protein
MLMFMIWTEVTNRAKKQWAGNKSKIKTLGSKMLQAFCVSRIGTTLICTEECFTHYTVKMVLKWINKWKMISVKLIGKGMTF